jgi:hypothetical protein
VTVGRRRLFVEAIVPELFGRGEGASKDETDTFIAVVILP